MGKSMWMRTSAAVFSAAVLTGGALAQGAPQFVIDRGLTDDLPYTVIYPLDMQLVDDENDATILSIQHPNALLRCDVFIQPSTETAWNADAAVTALDVPGTESTWVAAGFPGFKVATPTVRPFASGPALYYTGLSQGSPFGPPVSVIHAEAVDGGRIYVVECIAEESIAAQAQPLIDVIVANFSTNSNGQCCIDPADDRG